MTVELAHDIHGDGPLLVLIHGITENRQTWDPLLEDLATDHRVLRVDLRGHGDSPTGDSYGVDELAADVHALVDERPLVVGHSLGGMVATAYGAMFDARGIVNVDQSLDLAPLQAGLVEQAPVLRSEAFPLFIDAFFETMRGVLDEDEWARVSGLRRADQEVVLGIWSVLLDSSPEELAAVVGRIVGGLTAPYLSLHGMDPGPAYAEWLRRHIPQAQVEVWPDLGHYPHLARRQEFLDRLRAFELAVPAE